MLTSATLRVLIPGVLLAQAILAQAPVSDQPPVQAPTQVMLRLKNRTLAPQSPDAAQVVAPTTLAAGHLVLQFNDAPTQAVVDALNQRGVRVLADVPDNALMVSSDGFASVDDLGVRLALSLEVQDKISAMFSDPALWAQGYFLVEFHPDVDMGLARTLVLNVGLELRDNPDLSVRHLLVHAGDPNQAQAQILNLATADEVAYVFPSSDELISGTPAAAYAEALTNNGSAGQLIATYGDGWDGPGRNAATLNYIFSQMSAKLTSAQAQGAILRAMGEWSKVIKLTWQPGSSATAARTVNILFGRGWHGDAYPFDGPGGVLAHTFYPAPPNPEPIAGDMHLDDDENWQVGANTDLFSVALHELGHALGLGHSDNPAAVMYPYYKMVTGLAADDKNAILTLYAAQDGTPAAPTPPPSTPPPSTPPASGPLTLTANVPASPTTAAAVALTGTVTGANGTATVTWSSSTGSSGTALMSGSGWSIASVPLAAGANTITVKAADRSTQVSLPVQVTRQTAPAGGTPDTTAPSLAISSPGGGTVSTSNDSIVFQGTAADNVGVASVTWSTNMGFSGKATGTTQWNAKIPLITGYNTVTIRAFDAAGNSSWRSALVVRR